MSTSHQYSPTFKSVQSVTYNHFNSASAIVNMGDQLRVNLEYGPDDQRRMAKYWDDSGAEAELIKTRIYAGSFEKQINADLSEIEVNYISAGGQLVAMYVVESGVGSYYYPHLDHLGSIIHVTDETGTITYTQSFDPWGRTRNPNDLTYDNTPERPNWLWRGYTGHEHLDEFGLINMNGRLYDPVVGRMLSPDNYVQNPNFSQSYNRYSYVWNNPLKYNDPDGEWVHLVIGAVVGGVTAYISGRSAGLRGSDLFAYTAASAAIGAITAGVGSAAGSAASGIVATGTGFAAGSISGAASGVASGFVGGYANATLSNHFYGTSIDPLSSGLNGALIGGVSGGIIGGISGGIHAESNEKKFWSGKSIDSGNSSTSGEGLIASTQSRGQWVDKHSEWGDPGDVIYNGEEGIGGTNYVGPTSDKIMRQGLPPKDWIDHFALQHDMSYIQHNASGPVDAVLNQRVTGADIKLIQGASKVIKGYKSGALFDPSGVHAITQRSSNIAHAVRTSFAAAVTYKSTHVVPGIYTSLKYLIPW